MKITDFTGISNEVFRKLWDDYLVWINTGDITPGSELAKMRDRYKRKYPDGLGYAIMERDFLREGTLRFINTIKKEGKTWQN